MKKKLKFSQNYFQYLNLFYKQNFKAFGDIFFNLEKYYSIYLYYDRKKALFTEYSHMRITRLRHNCNDSKTPIAYSFSSL
jgi:hypothetical protein